MKKRVYLCILAACIALSATACGKKQDTPTISTESTSKVESNKSTEETSETETVATETETTEATETETVATETEATETESTETEISETTSTETEAGYKVTDINPAKTMYAKQPLNTRKGPGLSYDKVSVLKKHEAVTVNGIAEEENWYRLDNGSFVSGKYLLDKLPEEKPVETTKPEETKPSESTPAPEEPKHEENNTPSEEPKQDEPAPAPTPAPSEPETKPSEPTPSTPSEPEVKPSEPTPEPEPTPSEPEKICEHKNTHIEYGRYLNDCEPTCDFEGHGEMVCDDCGVEVAVVSVPATGNHDYEVTVNQEADCNNEGWETWRCKNCGHWEEYTYPIIPDKHDGYDVFEEDGIKYCSGCYEALD